MTMKRTTAPVIINRVNTQPTYDVYASVEKTDLGSVAKALEKITAEYKTKLKPGNVVSIRGQVESMESAFSRLGLGIVFAALLVYLLMVVNFQSFRYPFIIITALPGALCGMVWMLFLTGTTFSIPSLMGAIMSVGVATANSILLVSFAKDHLPEVGGNAYEAALEAGRTRLRPILMTAIAMIIGMLPMSLGLGEGGEQNAPLGRAVIGGLLLATFTTFYLFLLFLAIWPGKPKEDSQPSTVTLMNLIYHIVSAADWATQESQPSYEATSLSDGRIYPSVDQRAGGRNVKPLLSTRTGLVASAR